MGHSNENDTVSENKYAKNSNTSGDTIVRRGEDQLSKNEENTKCELQKIFPEYDNCNFGIQELLQSIEEKLTCSSM
jgi:hypothetical protein